MNTSSARRVSPATVDDSRLAQATPSAPLGTHPPSPVAAAAAFGEPFRTIVADPPWKYGDDLPGPGRGASKHYPTLTTEQIARREFSFPWPPLAPDSRLFLWATAPLLPEAIYVMRAWGFHYRTGAVWEKTGRLGMGHTFRVQHEHLLVGVRGRPRVLAHDVRSVFRAPATRHSRKPAEAYALIERLSPGPYVELFARESRPGWTTIGTMELERGASPAEDQGHERNRP